MSILATVLAILIVLFVFRKPIKLMFSKASNVSDSVSARVEMWCQEMDTSTLKELEEKKKSGEIDPKAKERLQKLLKGIE